MAFRCSFVTVALVFAVAACGDDTGIDDYYPELPPPTGGPQEAFAGEITQANANELVVGPAATGMIGDFFIRNADTSFIVSSASRVIGVVPQGGNVVDVVLRDATGQLVDDHFGEMSLLYVLGRTCEHDRIEIVRDGSQGGVAVIRAHGNSGNNDFINIKGIGLLTVEAEVDPDIDDGAQCATTYVLAPGARTLEVYYTLFNPTESEIAGPMGMLADTGGEVEAWGNGRGFERLSLSLDALTSESPLDYVVYQGPGVSYGILPRDPVPAASSAYLIAGVSVMLLGNTTLLDILNRDLYYLSIPAGKGYLQQFDLAVGRDAEDIDVQWREGKTVPDELVDVAGSVAWSAGGPVTNARVGVYSDADGDQQVSDPDVIVSYMDVAADGTFAGRIPTGNHLLRAEVKDVGRSTAQAAGDQVALVIPTPSRLDFNILDDQTNMPIPGRLMVVGDHPAFPDRRLFETYDRLEQIAINRHAIRGSSSVGGDPDPALMLPAGGTYRIYASRGTDWSMASQPFVADGDAELDFRLRQVVDSTGYLATDWHVHQLGSPDSPVPSDERVRSAVSAGVEMFAVTDHDYVADLMPMVSDLGLDDLVHVVSGIEVTPFAYGHFNAWPIVPDDGSPNKGAIDWARGMAGYSMTPGEIYDAMRARGAGMVQVNHPRSSSSFSEFQSFFDRAELTYDYTQRTIFGDFMAAGVPNSFLRLPDANLWSDQFNGLEVWNGFRTADSDDDGVREIQSQDQVLRDWFNMLSLGLVITPTGNSDTHVSIRDPLGMPRTMVRVTDDSPAALASGAAVLDVMSTLTGATARDVIVTNGPLIGATYQSSSAIGATVAPAGTLTLDVTIQSPEFAFFDTLEVFANSTPDIVPNDDVSAITPLKCWTSRALPLPANDACATASLAPEAMTVSLTNVAAGFRRYEATVTITLDAADIVNRAGATGQDAWLVLRARGDRAVFPLITEGAIDDDTRAAIMGGDPAALATALTGKGVPASAFTAPIFVDFDGGGYRAPFAP